MAKTIRLQPIKGKFLQTDVNGKQINIWLVNPVDMQQGTEVEYEDALHILAYKHPVATITPIKGKNGKFIDVLTDEDKAKIEELKRNPLTASTPAANSSNNLQKLIEIQSQLLQSQGELLAQMKKEIDEVKGKQKASEKPKADKK
jgi:hypothetical protein